MAKLSEPERKEALKALSGWRYEAERDAIARRFRFRDFSEAFAFMTRVAPAAEHAAHHPEWTNVWNRVDILRATSSAGGLTAKGVTLAKRSDGSAA